MLAHYSREALPGYEGERKPSSFLLALLGQAVCEQQGRELAGVKDAVQQLGRDAVTAQAQSIQMDQMLRTEQRRQGAEMLRLEAKTERVGGAGARRPSCVGTVQLPFSLHHGLRKHLGSSPFCASTCWDAQRLTANLCCCHELPPAQELRRLQHKLEQEGAENQKVGGSSYFRVPVA